MIKPTVTLARTRTPDQTPDQEGRRRSVVRVLTAAGAFAVIAALPPLMFDSYWLFLSAQVVAFAIATLGLDILYGRTGQLSLAHASFVGAGAYTTFIVADRGYGPLVQLAAVVAVAVVLGLVVAVPTLRLSGMRLALVTLAFGELFAWTLTHTPDWTGGTQGTPVPIIYVGVLDTSDPLHAYLLALAFAAAATAIAAHLARTQLGRRMLAVRDSQLAAQSVGVAIARTKVTAFLISAVFAGISGWLYAAIVGFIAPPDFALFASVFLFVAVVIGGAGTVLGAWLGAAYVVLVPETFNLMGHPNLYALVGGALLTIVALFVPDGMVGLLRGAARHLLALNKRSEKQ
jgi:branched-chain amino acid transport system permease protein